MSALRFCGASFLMLALSLANSGWANDEPLPPFSEVERVVESYFRSDPGHHPNDLISRSQVSAVLGEIASIGWQVEDAKKIEEMVLEDQHLLVSTFRTQAGRKFMKKISGRELMYDRFDRISQVSGGPELIRDIVKLPDGEKYAKPRSGGGVPDLLDLLPKNASGKTRKITDYHKPTGHIYTVGALTKQLQTSYQEAERKKASQKQDE